MSRSVASARSERGPDSRSCHQTLYLNKRKRGPKTVTGAARRGDRMAAPRDALVGSPMTPERWKRVEELYHGARNLAPVDRPAFLAAACPDDDSLRREVESLLAEPVSDDARAGAGPFLIPNPLVTGTAHRIMTGRSLGGYELQALIGAGGMGEVYRARDARLGRDVAIKILPHAFTSDPDRLARFEREARMLAALNHPNICAIYGFEDAQDITYLILELVEGETLANRIARARPRGAALPLGEAVTIARQIADALETAHDKGIVHRDLKPANISITRDGVVKVLDFGLAKPIGQDAASELTSAPEATHSEGRVGAVIGTAAYMSPEQARGHPIDRRTDVWAFACVLYEMLTGRVAFAGETVSDSIAKILEREPDWSALPAETPASIRRLLFRALTKDPRARLKDIADARIEIDAADDGLPEISARASVSTHTSTRVHLAWFAVAALAVGLTRECSTAPIGPEDVLANARFTLFTNWEGTEEGAAISPDGRFVAFLADSEGEFDLWLSQVGTDAFSNLTGDLPPLG